ncbi:unnamed protein product [Peronospora destructor]|uniref:Reverse transcriptase domain-containing protein n=1 Tax=Peronospora destructor TaxID=86335 RepID=A0AAV0TQW8_9STRA|nr:unnamed protein product [Peronospora destructor]
MVEEDYTAEKAADAWDKLKHKIVLGILRHKKAAKVSLKNTYRKKMKRLYRRYDQQMDREAVAVREGRDQLQGKTFTDLLHVISETKRNWLRSRQRRLFRSHTWRRGQTTKAMFQRISCRFGDNVIPTLRPAEGNPKRGVFEKAEILADAWSPILQGSATRAGKAIVVEWMPAGSTDDVSDLETQTLFTTETLDAAFKACKSGKACGPDRLGNDWYIHYSHELILLMLKLFRLWYNAHVCPSSFVETDVFCLKKKGNGSNPLNYRPLSLLNTDYKLFTRVIATAFRRTLDSRVHPHQHGFVPTRDIHAVLDYFMAAQATVPQSPELRDAVVLLLDFAKAYDTLDREFLYAVLSRHGYPPHLVEVIRTLHTGTSGRFLANG